MSTSLDRQLVKLVSKHRRNGIFLDTNVMLLFVFAIFMPDKIEASKRLAKYDREAAALLRGFVQQFDYVIATAHVLAETSNLARQNVHGKMWSSLSEHLFPLFCSSESRILLRSVDLAHIKFAAFTALGLTDAVIAATLGNNLLLTDDLDLYVAVAGTHDAINFTHMREAAGNL